MLKFYYSPDSCARAAHIALEEAGAAYERFPMSLAAGDQRKPEYLAINPKGRVPTLVTEHGVLTETPALLTYVARLYPGSPLGLPEDPFQLAQIESFNLYLCSTLHVAHAHKARGHRWVDDPAAIAAMRRKVPETVGACFELIENSFFRGPWAMGERFTICDVYLLVFSEWMEGDGVDHARFPKVAAHRAAMQARASVARVNAMRSS
ncbi:MAG TPA: glutathione S-transferase family protein [Acidisoma sp.]|jgi:glutathione S-transferase|nr:glutathione S-transferase family protein [Acidisoma sp.]